MSEVPMYRTPCEGFLSSNPASWFMVKGAGGRGQDAVMAKLWFNRDSLGRDESPGLRAEGAISLWNGVSPPPGAAVLGLLFDHFPKRCGPPEYHLRPTKRLKRGALSSGPASGCRVNGSGLKVKGAGFKLHCSGCKVGVLGFRVRGSGFRVQASGFRVQG